MSVGHQIGDKSHTIGKSYNAKTNEEMETQDFVNLDEGGDFLCCSVHKYSLIYHTLVYHKRVEVHRY